MKRCLITGCEGFIGSHLADLTLEKGLEVFGMVYEDNDNLKHIENRLSLIRADIKDRELVDEIVKKVKPDLVFHLAAQSYVTVSWEDPEETLKTNILGSLYILESLREHVPGALVEIVGSSAVYGSREESELPLSELTDSRPTSMYGVSKVGEEMLGYFYSKVYDMKTIRVRPFNMTGPRKTNDACSDFCRGIVEVEKGLKNELEVGNLDTVRDFTDFRDAVKALWLLVEKGKPGELYNLCSGKGWKMKDILNLAIQLSGKEIKYKSVPQRLRPFDDPILIGDGSRLRSLGWQPQIPMEETLQDMIEWWRQNLTL